MIAAAASGPTVATSDGRDVWTWRGGQRRRVGGSLPGVRALAWQSSALWALADGGVYRSGGAVLPWRRALAGLDGVSAIAGSEERLWLVLGGGLVVERARERCGSPWQGPSAGGELAQPRGLALSPDGWFAVGDTGHHRVVWYTLAGTCLDTFGVQGSVAGAFQEPTGSHWPPTARSPWPTPGTAASSCSSPTAGCRSSAPSSTGRAVCCGSTTARCWSPTPATGCCSASRRRAGRARRSSGFRGRWSGSPP